MRYLTKLAVRISSSNFSSTNKSEYHDLTHTWYHYGNCNCLWYVIMFRGPLRSPEYEASDNVYGSHVNSLQKYKIATGNL
mgnify:CR=1 FL=1